MNSAEQFLTKGSSGSAVADVQAKLLVLGFAVSPSERGQFGDETDDAVRSFQTKRGLSADGVVGPATYRELVESSHRLGSRMLYLRSPAFRGDDVLDIQIRLNALGFDAGKDDGVFGAETDWAVKQFQRNSGLVSDGIVAWSTVAALGRLSRRIRPASKAALREKLAREHAAGSSRRVFLDPGHGGSDPGITSEAGLFESYIVYRVAEVAMTKMNDLDITCILSRSSSEGLTDKMRVSQANELGADVAVNLHFGCRPEAGPSVAYWETDKSSSPMGQELASALASRLATPLSKTPATIGRGLPFLRHTRMPAASVDLRAQDRAHLVTEDSFLAELGESLALGVSAWFDHDS